MQPEKEPTICTRLIEGTGFRCYGYDDPIQRGYYRLRKGTNPGIVLLVPEHPEKLNTLASIETDVGNFEEQEIKEKLEHMFELNMDSKYECVFRAKPRFSEQKGKLYSAHTNFLEDLGITYLMSNPSIVVKLTDRLHKDLWDYMGDDKTNVELFLQFHYDIHAPTEAKVRKVVEDFDSLAQLLKRQE